MPWKAIWRPALLHELQTTLECWQSRLLSASLPVSPYLVKAWNILQQYNRRLRGWDVLCKKNSNTAPWFKEAISCQSSLVSCTVLCYQDEDNFSFISQWHLNCNIHSTEKILFGNKGKQGCVLVKGNAFHLNPRYMPHNGYFSSVARHYIL